MPDVVQSGNYSDIPRIQEMDTQATLADGLTPTSVAIGVGGTVITGTVVYSQTLTPASVAAATSAEQTFTVTGLATNDKVFINQPVQANSAVPVGVRVSAANTLAITFCNPTAGALVPSSGAFVITAIRS